MVCARGVLISTWFVVTPVTVKESPRTPLAAVQLGIVVPAASLGYRVLQVAAHGTGRARCFKRNNTAGAQPRPPPMRSRVPARPVERRVRRQAVRSGDIGNSLV